MTRVLYGVDDAAVHFAKVISDANPFTRREVAAEAGLSRQDYEDAIHKRAESIRRPGDSKQQAFTRYAVETDDGRALMKAALAAPPMAPPKQAPQDLKPKSAGPASEELERMARAMAKERKLTVAQAYSRLISDPDRKEMLAEIKREEARARAQISESRWPLHDAERQSKTREWLSR